MQKKRNNPQSNPSEFAYVRAALKLTLEISFDAIILLAFSISKYIRIEHNVRYSVVLFFFCIKFENETFIFRYSKIILIIAHQKNLHYIFENRIFSIATLIIYLSTS